MTPEDLPPLAPGQRRLVGIHQPDLLPYSGFWFKMAVSDVFIVAVHDQFQKHGYQRRVTMRERWCSHELVGKPALVPITSVLVREGAALYDAFVDSGQPWDGDARRLARTMERHVAHARLCDVVRGRYAVARHWRTRGVDLLERIAACQVDGAQTLDQVNLALIGVVRELLGITTPLVVTAPPVHAGVARLVEQVGLVGGTGYLSGTGGAAYMGSDPAAPFAAAGIELVWSDHRMSTGDSIVSVLLDADDPMSVVLARHQNER